MLYIKFMARIEDDVCLFSMFFKRLSRKTFFFLRQCSILETISSLGCSDRFNSSCYVLMLGFTLVLNFELERM